MQVSCVYSEMQALTILKDSPIYRNVKETICPAFCLKGIRENDGILGLGLRLGISKRPQPLNSWVRMSYLDS